MLIAYCIRRAGEPAPEAGLAGVEGAAVRLVEEAGLGMWLSEGAPSRTTPDRLREHDRVVRAALRSATPLPVRFGTRFDDEAAVRETLRARHEEFVGGLDRVAGRVEMGVRVLWGVRPPEPASPPEPARITSGRAYLEHRRGQLRAGEELRARAESLLGLVEESIAPLDLPTVREVVADEVTAGTLAHLVQHAALPLYRTRLEQARSRLGGAGLRLSGPWAPYSFV